MRPMSNSRRQYPRSRQGTGCADLWRAAAAIAKLRRMNVVTRSTQRELEISSLEIDTISLARQSNSYTATQGWYAVRWHI